MPRSDFPDGTSMQALVKHAPGPGNLELQKVPVPDPGPGQVRIRVACTGICGSDLHIKHDDIALAVNPPVVIGHEFSGTIVDVGEGVRGWDAGERVVAEIGFNVCGSCSSCLAGLPNLCDHRRSGGYWYDGAFTDYIVVPASGIHRLPENLSFEEASLIEPLSCVCHGVLELTRITAGDFVLVTGPGPIGLMALQVARAQGGRALVVGTENDRERLKLAVDLGAQFSISANDESLHEEIDRITENRGVDVVLECSGTEGGVDTGFRAVKKGGRMTQIGLFGKRIPVDFETICMKELKVTGSLGQRRISWQKALHLAAERKVDLKPLISHVLPLDRWQEAFRLAEGREGLKILLVPEASPMNPIKKSRE